MFFSKINDITETWRFDGFMLSLSKYHKINMIRGNIYRKRKCENSMGENGQMAIKEFHITFFYIYSNESF